MDSMKIEATSFLAQLHTEKPLPRVLAIVGEEAYYRDKVRKSVLQKIFAPATPEEYELTTFSEKTDLEQLGNTMNTYPFFGGKSAVLITDQDLLSPREREGKTSKTGEVRLKKLLDLLSDVPDFCTVLLQAAKLDGRQKLSKTLQKEHCVVTCEPLKSSRLEPWLRDQAQQHGASFTREGMEQVLSYMMNVDKVPMQLLAGEIEKLSLYAGSRKSWTGTDVDHIFSALPEANNFALADSLLNGKTTNFLNLLTAEKRKGTNLMAVLGMILFQVRNLLAAEECRRLGLSKAAMVRRLELHPFLADKVWTAAAHYPYEAVYQAVRDLDRLNIDFRRGGRGFARLEEIAVSLLSSRS
jgi:DNA polymerase-3 subunit delta